MATIQRFEDLEVWQKARIQASQIYEMLEAGAIRQDYELKNQMSRSSGSVMDNIAEGYGRGSRGEFVQFLGFANGSNDEVKSQLYRALDRKHLSQASFEAYYEQANLITKMLLGFIGYLNRTLHKGIRQKKNNSSDYSKGQFQEPEPFYGFIFKSEIEEIANDER